MQYGLKMYGDCKTHYVCGDCKNPMVKSITKVQKWMNSCEEAECVHRSFKSSSQSSTANKKRNKSKSKISLVSDKNKKSVSFIDNCPGKILRSASMIQPRTASKDFPVHSRQTPNFPVQTTTHIISKPPPSNNPVRTCSCVSNMIANKENFLGSHNNLQCSCPNPIQQVNHRVSNTRLLISGLKTELNKVKSQLADITVTNKTLSGPANLLNTIEAEKIISQLKLQNVQLKKELNDKQKELALSIKEVERAKEVLSEYEQKVRALHEQALRSSKLIKQNKDEFCKCLQEKEAEVKKLQESNESLLRSIRESEVTYKEMSNEYENLRITFNEETTKLSALTEDSKNFCECIKILEKQLENARKETEVYKEEVKSLEQHMLNFECELCQKLKMKARKHKLKINNKIKEHDEKEQAMMCTITQLSNELEVTKQIKISHEKLQNKYHDLEKQMKTQEEDLYKYRVLREKYQEEFARFRQNEENYEKDRQQLRNLVEELTAVIKQNKVTLQQLTAINKHQEQLLLSQTSIISEKDGKIKLANSEIEILRKQSLELQEEISVLKKTLLEPCKHESHMQLIEELQNIRMKLNEEIEKRLIKEKIIDDQANTIMQLQHQIKEKIMELNHSKQEIVAAEKEIVGINEDLINTQLELKEQYVKKELLQRRLKELKNQNYTLNGEISQLELLVEETVGTEKQAMIESLQQQIKDIQDECECEKLKVCSEKEKAVEAAQFATQKLLDTVNDFQRQVSAQKKVQYLLTKMLHDKEEDLKNVHSRLHSINSLTLHLDQDCPIDEIFKNNNLNFSEPNTACSYISSCSYCSKEPGRCRKPQTIRRPQFYDVQCTDEEPIKD
ncbi:probable DNA double-strand break repair Rad50 ATPase [Diabrotica virgifera virgifera]|uniref:Leucine-rich repeat-containing protein DDB_G0290503 n=2 Tax=Diabrotica virgifera virgifera TaxID=50390 RepID=A0ABM5KMW8_DIAVI|nr:probable DNA double-strand break repair Rad50 ATPase [Diabrotica virgifera virgifera]